MQSLSGIAHFFRSLLLAFRRLTAVLSKGPYSAWRKFKTFLIRKTGLNLKISAPANVQLSFNKTCNLRCTFCARQTNHIRNQLAEEKDLLIPAAFIEKNASLYVNADYVNLSADGEPLYHPEITNILKAIGSASKRNNIIFVTNGTLFTDEIIEQVVNSKIMEIHFSIDSIKSENIGLVRPGTDILELIRTIEKINLRKQEKGSRYPLLVMRSTFISQTISELPDMIDFCSKYGFATLLVQNMQIYKPELAPYSLTNCRDLVKETVNIAKDKGWRSGVEVTLDSAILNIDHLNRDDVVMDLDHRDPERETESLPEINDIRVNDLTGKCIFPWDFMLVQTNGDIYPCCFSMYKLGNLYESSWQEIWNGPRAKKLRKMFSSNTLPKECVNKPCGVGKIKSEIRNPE